MIVTNNIASIAAKYSVPRFVLVSTDKAVNPANIMGATKRAAEIACQILSEDYSATKYMVVRFGNVLDSSGSVIPLFKKQIEKGGPITVTDINMVRFFMTIPEAVELVIQSGAMAQGGDVFVLDMGEPVSINDLAIKMIQLSGLKVRDHNNPDGDIEISYTGVRPGEKLYEELLVGDNVIKTENRLIMRANEIMIEWKLLEPMLDELKEVSITGEKDLIQKSLKKIVPEYNY